nr:MULTISPECIES: DUF397 domain-containing protein [unclassified Streptomyces]
MSAFSESVVWRKSSYSTNGGNCVEVADGLSSVVPVRDSKVDGGPELVFAAGGWSAFVTGVTTGPLAA